MSVRLFAAIREPRESVQRRLSVSRLLPRTASLTCGQARGPFGPCILSGRNGRLFRRNQVQPPQLQPHLQAQPEGILPFQPLHHPHCVQDLQQLLL